MILFHGTNTDIETIDLSRSLNHKDFGKGFYLTDSRETAIRMATKKARLFGGKAKNKLPLHDYDIIVGPIADDGVVVQITRYRENIYSAEQAAKGLQDKFLDQQYYFGSEKALRYLKKSKVQIL
jgi:hypothetical protein